MALLLKVPYGEKEEAKALGAKWNVELKKWYISSRRDYPKFQKWYVNPNADLIISNHLFIIVGEQECFKCKQKTKVVSLAADMYTIVDDQQFEFNEGDINFIQDIDGIPQTLEKYLKDNYQYYLGYSKTTQSKYYGNHCDNCGVLQGNFFLYSEPDSPFFMDSIEKAKSLTVFKVDLPFDLAICGSVGWCSGDYMIKEYAQIINLELEF